MSSHLPKINEKINQYNHSLKSCPHNWFLTFRIFLVLIRSSLACYPDALWAHHTIFHPTWRWKIMRLGSLTLSFSSRSDEILFLNTNTKRRYHQSCLDPIPFSLSVSTDNHPCLILVNSYTSKSFRLQFESPTLKSIHIHNLSRFAYKKFIRLYI